MDTITVAGTADLAVTIPYQLGYHPGQSLVVVGLTGRSVLGIMRLDLCEPDRPDFGSEALTTFTRVGADGVLIVAFEARASQGASLLRSFRDGATARHLAVLDCIVVREGEWFAVSPTGHASGLGRSLPDPSRVPAIAEFVARGRSPLADRQALTALVECEDSLVSQQVAARVSDLVASMDPAKVRVTDLGDLRITTPSVRAWQGLLTDRSSTVPESLVAAALVGLLDREWRDGLLAWLCPDTLALDDVRPEVLAELAAIPRPDRPSTGPASAGRTSRSTDPDGSDDAPGENVVVDPEVTSVDQIARRLLSWCRLVPDASGEVAAAALTVAAHLLWHGGDGTLAAVALERALRIDPRYRLAVLLDRLVAAGVPGTGVGTERLRSTRDAGHAA